MHLYRRVRKKRIKPLIFIILSLSLTVWFISSNKPQTVISPLADENPQIQHTPTIQQTKKPLLGFLSKSKKPEQLKTVVKTLADSKWKNYSVLVMDLNSDFVMGLNETAIYDAASVNKIPILAALYHAASVGSIDMNKQITIQAKDVQDYGTGSIRYDPPGSVYSVKTLANLMIKKSDNTAAYVLANFILKLKDIQTYMEELGLTQTNMESNTTSNKDIAHLFKKIFRGDVANAALTAEMTGLMKDTDFEDRLPAKLPEGVTVYHKIGTGLGGAVHDAGVVQHGDMKYYIGVFTGDTTDEERTAEEIAQISLTIYDFMR